MSGEPAEQNQGEPLALVVPAASEPAPGLIEAVESWRSSLAGAGVACRGVALHGIDSQFCLELPDAAPDLVMQWIDLRSQIQPGAAPRATRVADRASADFLLVSPIQLPDGQAGVVGVVLAAPCSERTIHIVQLALGWLQTALSAQLVMRSRRAQRLLVLLGHAASQTQARAAAQEWINRTAAWAREEAAETAPAFGVMLFEVRDNLPRWWVAADAAWVEKASPAVQAATELAMQAVVEQQDVFIGAACALPVIDDGQVVAVLVASAGTSGTTGFPDSVVAVLRTSLGMAEPLLRHWRKSERPLWRHALDAIALGWRRLREPGQLTWKLGAAGAVLGLLLLLALPVPDRVSASTVIEGRQRHLVTAPFDGFIAQVLVRPGERVAQGQLLARLDDRDLKLEQARQRSEREQAAGRLRQAMADREAAAMVLALAEVQQAEAQLSLVEAKLLRTGLTAAQDGLVVSGDWVQQLGGPVETGKEMFEIASGEGYRVVLHLPDRDIARVRVGQGGVLRLTGQPQAVHHFRVANVTATASVQDGVNGFRVEADWVGAAPPLSPGMQGIGKVEVGTANLLTIWTRSSVDWLRLKLWSWW